MSVVKDRALFLPNDRNSFLLLLVMWKDFPACVLQAQNANRKRKGRGGGLWQIQVEGLGLDLVVDHCALDVQVPRLTPSVCVCACVSACAIFQYLHCATH